MYWSAPCSPARSRPSARLPLLMVALSLFYVGGMFLNDAFDRDFDAQHRPDRPIPSGQVTARQVFGWGFGLLALGLAGVGLASRGIDGAPAPARAGRGGRCSGRRSSSTTPTTRTTR